MISNKILTNLKHKGFYNHTVPLTAVEQVIIETRWTDHLQRLIEFGNKNYLKNFSLRLEMDEDNDLQRLGGKTK